MAPPFERPDFFDEFADIFLQTFYHIINQVWTRSPDKASLKQALDIFHHPVQVWPDIVRGVIDDFIDASHKLIIVNPICILLDSASQLKLSNIRIFHPYLPDGLRVKFMSNYIYSNHKIQALCGLLAGFSCDFGGVVQIINMRKSFLKFIRRGENANGVRLKHWERGELP